MKSVCIAYACGCPRMHVDTAKLFGYFESNGWTVTDELKKADLVLVTTCGVNVHNEEKSMKYLSIVNANINPNSKLIVLGCLAYVNEHRILSRFNALPLPPGRMEQLDQITGASIKYHDIRGPNYIKPYITRAMKCLRTINQKEVKSPIQFFLMKIYRSILKPIIAPSFLRVLNFVRFRKTIPNPMPGIEAFYIRVSHGCLGSCTYCAIKHAHGPFSSRPLQEILKEFDDGLQHGFKEFKIVGADIGPYGQDIGTNIIELFRTLLNKDGDFRLSFHDIHPAFVVQHASELTEIILRNADKHIGVIIPIQSGNDEILSLMKRGYNSTETMDCLCALREACPRLIIATHVMVGFPGESDDQFEDTIRFLKRVNFHRIDIYKYDDRPNTEASQFHNKIPEHIKEKRLAKLQEEFKMTSYISIN